MFPMLCLHCAQLGVKLSPKAPSCGTKLRHARIDLNFHVRHMASIWGPSGSLWAQLQPNMATWRQLGPPLGPSSENFLFYRYFHLFPTFFGFDGFVRGHVAHIGRALGPTSAPDAPTHDQVQTCPSCAILYPSWGQVWARVRRKLRPSWAQVGSCLAQLKAKDGDV